MTCYNASREDGPIAQRLELPAHKKNCAHALFHTKLTEVGGTKVKVSKAGSYPAGKPKRGQEHDLEKSDEIGILIFSGSYAVYG